MVSTVCLVHKHKYIPLDFNDDQSRGVNSQCVYFSGLKVVLVSRYLICDCIGLLAFCVSIIAVGTEIQQLSKCRILFKIASGLKIVGLKRPRHVGNGTVHVQLVHDV